jgi:hypothetical protein
MNHSCEVAPVTIPNQLTFDGTPFPLVLCCQDSAKNLAATLDWVIAERRRLLQQSSEHGAILFRGFPLCTAEDFDDFVAAFGLQNFAYKESLSNAVRVNRTDRVFTANEAPSDVMIFLHHEMAQTPVYPSRLFFFCEQPADEGGATPICRSDVLLERMVSACPEFVTACQKHGLKYSNVMPLDADLQSGMGRSWKDTFRADDQDDAEQRMQKLGYTWEWQADGSLRATTPVLEAVRELPGGRRSFFNQLIAAFQGWKDARNDPGKSITLGDGTPLDPAMVDLATQLAEAVTFDVHWQAGDVALVDNFVAMHGRRTFQGTRKVLASLVALD